MIDPFTSHFFRNAGQNGPIILMYHSIERAGARAEWPWSISLDLFKGHLDLLCEHGWTTGTTVNLAGSDANRLAPKTVVITFDDGFENNLDAADALVERGMLASWFIVSGSIGKAPHWDDKGRPEVKMLSASNLRELDKAGMEIGSHSVNHCKLPELSDAELELELNQSKSTLEDTLGKPVEAFAYPYGDWDERCEIAVGRAGYKAACTTRTGTALKDKNPLRLRRLTVFNREPAAVIARKLTTMSNEGNWTTIASYYRRRFAARLRPGAAQ